MKKELLNDIKKLREEISYDIESETADVTIVNSIIKRPRISFLL